MGESKQRILKIIYANDINTHKNHEMTWLRYLKNKQKNKKHRMLEMIMWMEIVMTVKWHTLFTH